MSAAAPATTPLTGLCARLRACRSGVAMTEFALSLPLLFGVGLYGIEAANLATTQRKLSQVAIHIADNASRIGDTSMLQDRKIYESDINDVFIGSNLQAGDAIDLYEHGRVIISSQEVVPDSDDDQYIHWQRCLGKKAYTSAYGDEGTGLLGGFAGMGPPGEEVLAFDGEAVIFVEVAYEYQPLVGDTFAFKRELRAIASFTVRDSRDLTQIYQRDPSDPSTVARCSDYTGVSSDLFS